MITAKIKYLSCLVLFIQTVVCVFHYDSFEFTAVARHKQSYQPFLTSVFMDQDQSHMTVVTNTGTDPLDRSREINLYSVAENNISFIESAIISQVQLIGTYPLIRTTTNLSIIAIYTPNSKRLRIYRRQNLKLKLIDDFKPLGTTTCTSLQMSLDANYINIGVLTTMQLATFEFNGTNYIARFPLMYLPTVSIVRELTPDGKFIVYGEGIGGVASVRILKNDATLLQVAMESFTLSPTPASSTVPFIRSSISSSGVYNIIVNYRLLTNNFVVFMKFDPFSNAFTIFQPIASNIPVNQATIMLTQNGNYLAIMDQHSVTDATNIILKLYEKQNTTGQFSMILNLSRFATTGLFYLSEDGKFIAGRRNQSNLILFLFVCEVPNCAKCMWKNTCDFCKAGYELTANRTCVCPQGMYNLGGSCIPCYVSNCEACSASNYCSYCIDGYSLSSGTCVCPIGKNISLITNECVDCNVLHCVKCSFNDVCDIFQIPDLDSVGNLMGSSIQSSRNRLIESKNTLKNNIKFLFILVGVVFALAILFGIILCLFLKLKKNQNAAQSNKLQHSMIASLQTHKSISLQQKRINASLSSILVHQSSSTPSLDSLASLNKKIQAVSPEKNEQSPRKIKGKRRKELNRLLQFGDKINNDLSVQNDI